MISKPQLQARQIATGVNPVKSPSVASARISTAPSAVPVEEEADSPFLDLAPSAASSSSTALPKPTVEERSSLLAVHASSARRRGAKKTKFVAKVFNPQASRPQPTLSTPWQEFRVTLSANAIAFTTSTSVPVYFASAYSLANFNGAGSYTSLFDEYKIEQFEVWLEPSIIMSPSAGSAVFYSAIDLDDANVPVSVQDVDGRQGCVVSETGTGHYHKWRPYVANALYSGAFTSYGSEPSQWIDCASSSVYHYGIKAAVPAADGIARAYYLEIRAMVAFRGSAI